MASKRQRRKESAPGWAWMLFGLSIGLAVALVVYLRSGGPTVADRPARPIAEASAPPETSPARQAVASANGAAAAADDRQAGSDEPGFSFFEDLGKSEVIVDAGEFDFGPGGETPRVVLVQAGAFRDIDDADARQARLALLGYESHIDTGIVSGDLWFRVLIGPLTERGEINETVGRLRSAGIETVLRTVTN